METIKKYTAIKLGTQNVNDTIKVDLEYGDVTGSYYDREHPKEEFETEEEAIEHAYKEGQYDTWLIVPVVRFKREY